MGARIFIEGYELDTFGDIDVDFSFSVSDISDIEKRNTSFSKTILLPNSANNQKLFGNIFNISATNDYYPNDLNVLVNFNPAKVAAAHIYLDGIKIFDGVLRLIKINDKNGDITYETNVFGKLNDILAAIGDKDLSELDWSDYDHTYNMANVTDSWNREEWVEGEQNYVYPLVDYGVTLDGITYPFQNFRPALFIREILGRIFKESGFKIIAPFFNTEFFKRQILIPAEKNITKLASSLLNAYCTTTTLFRTIVLSQNFSPLFNAPFQQRIENGFTSILDGFGYYSNFEWTQASTPNVNISVNYKFQIKNNTIYDTTYRVFLYKNTDILATQTFINSPFLGGNTFNLDFIANVSTQLALNDIIAVRYSIETGSLGDINSEFTFIEGTFLKVNNIVPLAIDILEGDAFDFENAVPKSIKQRDFLKSIITMYNLYVVPDKLQEKVLEFIPHPLFYSNIKNEAIDWTDKVDKNQDISSTPISDLTAREYRIGFTDDSDYWSTFYKTKFNLSYGESRTILDNDFELDTKEIKVIFGCPVMRQEVGDRKMIHLYKVENNVKVRDNFKPRVASWMPNVYTFSAWNIQSVLSGTVPFNVYPYAGHFDNPITPTNDILFGIPKEVYFPITTYPSANLYSAFYEVLITSIGDKNSRRITGQFYLNPVDIMNLDFRQIIKFGNHYYELHKVEKYNPINNVPCTVHLFKILGQINPLIYENIQSFLMNEDGTFLLQQNGVDRFYI